MASASVRHHPWPHPCLCHDLDLHRPSAATCLTQPSNSTSSLTSSDLSCRRSGTAWSAARQRPCPCQACCSCPCRCRSC
eukprot:2430868-Pyramimonas_sp.AAC.1